MMRSSWLRGLLIASFYVAVAVVMLAAPLAALPDHVPTVPDGSTSDYYHFHWNYWWIGHALSQGLNVYQTEYVMAPFLNSLALHTLTPIGWPLWALVTPILGTAAGMAAVEIALLALAGIAFYGFLRQQGADRGWALVGGLMLEVSPLMVNGIYWTNLNIMGWFWLPLLLIVWGRIVALPVRRAALWIALLGLSVWGMGLTDPQYFLFAPFVIAPYGLWTLIRARSWGRRAALIGAVITAGALALVLLIAAGPLDEILVFDTSALAPTPADRAVAAIGFPECYVWHCDRGVPVGAVVLPLTVAALVVTLWRRPRRDPVRWLWLACVPVPLILSAGAAITVGSITISLPYVWLHEALGGMFRYPERFAPVFLIPAVTFAALTFSAARRTPLAENLTPQTGNLTPLASQATLSQGEGKNPPRGVYPLLGRGSDAVRGEVGRGGSDAVRGEVDRGGADAVRGEVGGGADAVRGEVDGGGSDAVRGEVDGGGSDAVRGEVGSVGRERVAIVFPLLIAVILLDARVFEPIPVAPLPPAHVMHQRMAAEPVTYVVVDVPTAGMSGEGLVGDARWPTTQFYGLTHQQRMVNGHISRIDTWHFMWMRDGDALMSWLGVRRWLDAEAAAAQLAERIPLWPIGYVVVHENLLGRDSPALTEIYGFLNAQRDHLCPPISDGEAAFYRTVWLTGQPGIDPCPTRRPPPDADGGYTFDLGAPTDRAYLGWGWYPPETFGGITARWAGTIPLGGQTDPAPIQLFIDLPPDAAELIISAQSYHEPRRVTVRVNDQSVGTVTIVPDVLAEYTVRVPAGAAGDQTVITLVVDGAVSPADVAQGDDTRRLSLLVDRIRWQKDGV